MRLPLTFMLAFVGALGFVIAGVVFCARSGEGVPGGFVWSGTESKWVDSASSDWVVLYLRRRDWGGDVSGSDDTCFDSRALGRGAPVVPRGIARLLVSEISLFQRKSFTPADLAADLSCVSRVASVNPSRMASSR